MLKRDGLIEQVMLATEGTQTEAKAIIEAILDGITRALRAGQRVEIRGFGTFGTRGRPGHVSRNPKTGARVEVPPKRTAYFRLSAELKARVNANGHG
jgi:integration host factor subunit beta